MEYHTSNMMYKIQEHIGDVRNPRKEGTVRKMMIEKVTEVNFCRCKARLIANSDGKVARVVISEHNHDMEDIQRTKNEVKKKMK